MHQIDAPDGKNPKCEGEKALAALTEERLGGLLLAAKDVEFHKTGRACLQFMDCNGFVKADGVDVGDTLIAEELAVPDGVDGDGMPPFDWCNRRPPAILPDLPPAQNVAPLAPGQPAPT